MSQGPGKKQVAHSSGKNQEESNEGLIYKGVDRGKGNQQGMENGPREGA